MLGISLDANRNKIQGGPAIDYTHSGVDFHLRFGVFYRGQSPVISS